MLDKPDFTAADCVPTGVPGYSTFCGTSAAGPHAGAIAALALQAKPSLTVPQMRSAFAASALDIEGPEFDIHTGAGIVMAPAAVTAALNTSPSINAGGVVDNASYDSPIAPGSIAALFGANLTDGTSCLPPACNPTSKQSVISNCASAS